MFYSNNSYMEDLYYYNQMPNNTYMNGLGNNPIAGGNLMNPNSGMINQNPMFWGQMNNGQSTGPMQLMNLYPSIYRIINPVVSKVVSNSNNQMINDDFLNNMVDTVFNIVEGQINMDEESTIRRNIQNDNQTNINSSNSNSNTVSNINSSNRTSENTRQNNNSIQTNNTSNSRNDSLLRDLIRILIIKELLLRYQYYQRQYMLNQGGMPAGYNMYF